MNVDAGWFCMTWDHVQQQKYGSCYCDKARGWSSKNREDKPTIWYGCDLFHSKQMVQLFTKKRGTQRTKQGRNHQSWGGNLSRCRFYLSNQQKWGFDNQRCKGVMGILAIWGTLLNVGVDDSMIPEWLNLAVILETETNLKSFWRGFKTKLADLLYAYLRLAQIDWTARDGLVCCCCCCCCCCCGCCCGCCCCWETRSYLQ